jgi:hypothetical protein
MRVMKGFVTMFRLGLATQAAAWQRPGMATDPKYPSGGGIFIALGAFGGVAAGRYFGGQTSIGLIAGFAAGTLVALAMWWFSRR